jgi:ubiquinone/menaquinone biosynthesis C-methylase UbiE
MRRRYSARMTHRICPWWLGYVLLSPLRRWRERPAQLLGGLVREGMTVIEPGCGMGFFTLELARLVGPHGRVVALDVQPRMLSGLRRRAVRAGLADRIDARLVASGRLAIDDLAGAADAAVALYVVHEVPDQRAFLAQIAAALRPGGRLLVVEPAGHVTAKEVVTTLDAAAAAGLARVDEPSSAPGRAALFERPVSAAGTGGT